MGEEQHECVEEQHERVVAANAETALEVAALVAAGVAAACWPA